MSYLYLIVRYLGLFIAIVCGCFGGLVYIPEAPYVPNFVLQPKVPTVVEPLIL
ncbi:hypothetical protein M405DRAFT_870454 [Rhizopogon salebrosus TDB-379]|nr:hypothetical protein M405DRAFT_870454 [Rhizopogon salebrosus TDB-379]